MQEISAANTIFYCNNWRETADFYQHTLGLPVNFSHQDWLIEFRINSQACLSVADAARCTIASAGGKGVTLTLCVEDLAAVHRQLSEKGVEVGEIRSSEWRAPWFYVFDPEGNRLEFWQSAPL